MRKSVLLLFFTGGPSCTANRIFRSSVCQFRGTAAAHLWKTKGLGKCYTTQTKYEQCVKPPMASALAAAATAFAL